MRSKTYAPRSVNHLDVPALLQGHDGQDLCLGIDVGKRSLWIVLRWSHGPSLRPWRVLNPDGIPALVALLGQLRVGRQMVVALEPSGTYGDALRQALHDVGIPVQRVRSHATRDYSEIYDGVPSQHDGKDAAMLAELAEHGKASPWPYEPTDPWSHELAYWVEEMEGQRRLAALWQGRLEGLLARHWPEATQVMPLRSGVLLRTVAHYGSPAALAADAQAAERLSRWGGALLDPAKVSQLLAGARASVGVRVGDWQTRRLRENATRAWEARQAMQRCVRELERLAEGHAVLQAQGAVVGKATACVLWAGVGDPRKYSSGPAYRKAMGLNLKERSSGAYQGMLKLSKRGSARVRQWLYLAALRWLQRRGVRGWYRRRRARDGRSGKRLVVALMRKLALALYRVGACGVEFEARRLFGPRRQATGRR